MATIADLVTRYMEEHLAGNMLETPDLTAVALKAVRFYQGYAALDVHLLIPISVPAPVPPTPYPAITSATDISLGEWSIISPLFVYYVEKENAVLLEASRSLGVDVYGRSVAEIQGDINQCEMNMQREAFSCSVVSIL